MPIIKTLVDVTVTEQQIELDIPLAADFLGVMKGLVTAKALGASAVTWALARDALGNIPLTERMVRPITSASTTPATLGSLNSWIGEPYDDYEGGTPGKIWLLISCDVGSCTVLVEIGHESKR